MAGVAEGQTAVLLCPDPFNQIEDKFIRICINLEFLVAGGLIFSLSIDFQAYRPSDLTQFDTIPTLM